MGVSLNGRGTPGVSAKLTPKPPTDATVPPIACEQALISPEEHASAIWKPLTVTSPASAVRFALNAACALDGMATARPVRAAERTAMPMFVPQEAASTYRFPRSSVVPLIQLLYASPPKYSVVQAEIAIFRSLATRNDWAACAPVFTALSAFVRSCAPRADVPASTNILPSNICCPAAAPPNKAAN